MWPLEEKIDPHSRLYNNAKAQRDRIEKLRQLEREKDLSRFEGEYVLSEHEAEESSKRLYYYAQVKQDRIEYKREQEREKEEAKMETMVRTKSEADKSSDRLYTQAILKKDKLERIRQEARDEENEKLQHDSLVLNKIAAEMSSSRLYNKSIRMQAQGKQRRMEIEEKHAKRAPTPTRKIKLEDANKIYERGMVHKLIMEIKREEASITKNYVSPLLDPLVSDRSKTPIKTLSNKNTSLSRIRARSRVRSGTPSYRRQGKTPPQSAPVALPPSTRKPTPKSGDKNQARPAKNLTRSSSSLQSIQNAAKPKSIRRSRSATPVKRVPNIRRRSPTPTRIRRHE